MPDATSELPNAPDAVSKIVREEIERSNKYLEFAQGQIAKDRSFYKHLYAFSGGFLVSMVAAAGYLQYSSVSQMRTDFRTSYETERNREKEALEALLADDQKKVQDMQTMIAHEVSKLQSEMAQNMEAQFRSPNIAKLVADAVAQRTNAEFVTIITSKVHEEFISVSKNNASSTAVQ
jgi:hypothetical protein